MSEPAVGIDLGTCFATIAACGRDGRPRTMRAIDDDGPMATVVYLDKSGPVVGEEALRIGEFDPLHLARHAKRDMGERAYRKTIRGETMPAAVVQALVLRQLKGEAERRLGPFTKAVITVPACFDEPCRHATADAARLAGLELLELLPDPLAATIAHDANRRGDGSGPSPPETVLVCDLGGGTFDATAVRIVGREHTMLATAGDVYLGGCDFDRLIVAHVAGCIAGRFGGVDPRDDDVATEILTQRAVEAKRVLTVDDEAAMHFRHRGNRFEFHLTRAEFDEATTPLVDRVRAVVRRAVDALDETVHLERLLLVGGGTRIPAVRTAIEQEIGLAGELLPNEAIAHGAALYADHLVNPRGGASLVATGIAPYGLALLGKNRSTGQPLLVPLVDRGTPLPVRVERAVPTARANQQRLRLTLVEGVTTPGEAPTTKTTIGRGVLEGLPSGLPARTPVHVSFQFSRDGRFSLRGRLPNGGTPLESRLERITAIGEAAFEKWALRITNGFAEESVDDPLDEDEPGNVSEFDLDARGTTEFDIDIIGIDPED